MNKSKTEEIPAVDWGLTPITDGTFERMGWIKINTKDPENVFYEFEEEDDDEYDDSAFLDSLEEDSDELDSDDPFDDGEDNFYFWVLKLPRDNSIPYKDGCPVLISSISNERFKGPKKPSYLVQIHDFYDLGICLSEEEIEILYRSLTNKDIYDF